MRFHRKVSLAVHAVICHLVIGQWPVAQMDSRGPMTKDFLHRQLTTND